MTSHLIAMRRIKSHLTVTLLCGLLLALGIARATDLLTPAKEIALIIGEPWKDMQARSSAKIADDIPNEIWYRMPKELAYLRFADYRYGFVTPPAKFFSIGFNRGKIDSIRMSPQTEPLPLDEALKVVLDLQEQLQMSGWQVMYPREHPPHADTPEWRSAIQDCTSDQTYWLVPGHYQIMMVMSCYGERRVPENRRYLITLSMGKPWH